jgi:hypothetical protein
MHSGALVRCPQFVCTGHGLPVALIGPEGRHLRQRPPPGAAPRRFGKAVSSESSGMPVYQYTLEGVLELRAAPAAAALAGT